MCSAWKKKKQEEQETSASSHGVLARERLETGSVPLTLRVGPEILPPLFGPALDSQTAIVVLHAGSTCHFACATCTGRHTPSEELLPPLYLVIKNRQAFELRCTLGLAPRSARYTGVDCIPACSFPSIYRREVTTMRCTILFRLARRAPALCALALMAVSAGRASAQVASPITLFGRQAYIVEPPASYYGYNLDDAHPGYYGGDRYREYYAYGRGYGIANFPGPVPGPDYYWDWTSPWRRDFVLRPPVPAQPYVAHAVPAPAAVPLAPAEGPVAHFTIAVPAAAEVYLEGVKTRQTGTTRQFVSPQLVPGRQYVYEIRGRWIENGREVVQTRNLVVTAGERLFVDLASASPNESLPTPRPFPMDVQ
jgi:uncharacterized protein (TIGR03000 family)